MRVKRKIKQSWITFINRIRLNVRVNRGKWFFRLSMHEKAKPFIKYLKYILTAISLLAAFYTFENSIYSFLFGVVVFLALTFIEKIIFIYNSLVVFPGIKFEYNPEGWLGCFFGVATPEKGPEIPLMGLVLHDATCAVNFHQTLLNWSVEHVDESQRVCLSVVELSEKEYVLFCYPNTEIDEVKDYHHSIESERRKVSLTDEHLPTFVMPILGKRCFIDEGSYYKIFKSRYQEGVPVLFQLCVPNIHNEPEPVADLENFVFFNLKFKNKAELTRKDVEFDLIRVNA